MRKVEIISSCLFAAAIISLCASAPLHAGYTWSDYGFYCGDGPFSSIASSSDGKNLAAVSGYQGYIYTSTNSGQTWAQQTSLGIQFWTAIASSSDGTKLAAVVHAYSGWDLPGYIYTSADSGQTWTPQTNAGCRQWTKIASSSDGTKLAAVDGSPGYIYTSTDSGQTWTQQTNAGSRQWQGIASSSDGTMLAAVAWEDYIYISTDCGQTWTQQAGTGTQAWTAIASSADGSLLVAGTDGGDFWTGSVTSPSIDTPTSSAVTTSTATLGATIELIGATAVTAAGVAYGTNPNPETTGDKKSTTITSGAFTVEVTGLTSNTLYHFRGYATNSLGTSYTDDTTFTTVANAPTATRATDASASGFTANWTAPKGTGTITGYQLDVATDSNFTSFVSGYNDLTVSDTSAQVTGLSAGTYYYRVRAVNAGGTSADSNSEKVVFTPPPPPPTITVTSPDGNSWTAGGKCTISWSYTGNPGSSVKIELLSGSASSVIAHSASTGKDGTGSYSWTIPNTQASGDNYRISVTSASVSSCTNTSSPFTINPPTIAVTSPGGSSWNAGGKYTVSWSYTGGPGNVRIDLLKSGTKLANIVASTSAGSNGTGSYSWTIPNTELTGSGYQIAVSSTTVSSCTTTSNPFTIIGPTISVTAPTGGSSWSAGTKCPISWNYTGNPGNVEIHLLQNGTKASTITPGTPTGSKGTGSYSWSIPKSQAGGTDYAVMVSSTANGQINSVSNSFTITSLTASAGPDQKASEAAAVKLSGTNSITAGGRGVSYLWTQLDGPPVVIAKRSSAETGFIAPEAGPSRKSLRFQLTVTGTDGDQSKDECLVNVPEDNAPPTADAGPTQTVTASQIVELNGLGSSTGDAGTLSYSWRQISGATVSLSDPFAAQPTFVGPDPNTSGESLVFELTVTDQAGLRSRDTCIVNVVADGLPPIAQAGPNQTVSPGRRVFLDGTGSTDKDDSIVSYSWRQISGQPVTLSNPTAIKPAFVAPVIDASSENLVFELTVTNSSGLRDKAKVVITVINGAAVK